MGSSVSSHKVADNTNKNKAADKTIDKTNDNKPENNADRNVDNSAKNEKSKQRVSDNKVKGNEAKDRACTNVDDSISIDSKDSDDTFTLEYRMPSYSESNQQLNDQSNVQLSKVDAVETDKVDAENKVVRDGNVKTVSQRDNASKTIGDANNCAADKNNPEQKENNKTKNEEHQHSLNQENRNNKSLKNKNDSNRPTTTRKLSTTNKQTLVLAKVGVQYRYITVSTYLPDQKVRRSSSSSFPQKAARRKSKDGDIDDPLETVEENTTTKTESEKRKSRKKSPEGQKITKLPTCSLPSNMTSTFYVGGGNGTALVEGPLTGLGWKRITDKYDDKYRLKWVECKSKINYNSFKEGEQMVNHLPNSHLLTNKLGLLNSLKEYERITLSTKGRLPRLRMSDFHPETYKLDEKSDRDLFLEIYKDGEIWICKPIGLNQGKGIFLIRSREAIQQLVDEREQKKSQHQKPGRPVMNRIVQRYIMRPLLLEGRKFDVRTYMLIASTVPFVILYHKGYVRLSCLKYDPEDTNLGIHLTNQYIQKKDPLYKDVKENTAWSMDKLNEYINTNVRGNIPIEIEEDWVYNTFTKQMQKIMIHCFNSVKHKLQSRIGYFDLFGLDFMVDAEMKVHLIEVNTNPALHCNCEALKEVIPGVVEESLFVAIECFEKSRKNLPLLPLQSLNNFTILYCGTRANTTPISRTSRSVSPVKEMTAEKPKPSVLPGTVRSLGQRSTQSTSVYTSVHRKSVEKADLNSGGAVAHKEVTTNENSEHVLMKTASTTASVKSSVGKSNLESDIASKLHSESGKNETQPDQKQDEKSVKIEPKPRVSTVVTTDTLSKTTDSLNQATTALGRLSISLNQGSLTDSLLEEVRLKMTHAELQSASVNTKPVKPVSARSTRERDNLERGN